MVICSAKEAIILALCIIIPNIPGFCYSMDPTYRENLSVWFEQLNFPSFRPPNWLFAPVWTYLYCTMGIAWYIVYISGGGFFTEVMTSASVVYIIQLILNWLWSPIFFYGKYLLAASIEIFLTLVAVIVTGLLFFNINKWSGVLFIPYVVWMVFATQFCIRIYLLNRAE